MPWLERNRTVRACILGVVQTVHFSAQISAANFVFLAVDFAADLNGISSIKGGYSTSYSPRRIACSKQVELVTCHLFHTESMQDAKSALEKSIKYKISAWISVWKTCGFRCRIHVLPILKSTVESVPNTRTYENDNNQGKILSFLDIKHIYCTLNFQMKVQHSRFIIS